MQCAVMDMHANNRTRIRCPCARCKEGVLLDPFDHGTLKAHLLMSGYTQWISEEDDDGEDVHMAENNDMGLDEEMTDRQEDDGAGHVGGEESGNNNGDGEDSGHDEEEAAVTPQSSTLLSAVVQDPHVRDLLRKSTTRERELLLERRPSWRNLK